MHSPRVLFPRLHFAALLLCLAGPGSMPAPASDVTVEVFERDIPDDWTWPRQLGAPEETYAAGAFGFVEYPQKYVGTGVRADRANPFLFRARATLTLPEGDYQVLLRSRGAARLRFGGEVLTTLEFFPVSVFAQANSGELPVTSQDQRLDLGPRTRRPPPGSRETVQTWRSSGRPVDVTLDVLVGGVEPKSKRRFRPELGETVVAVAPAGSDEWTVLSPGQRIVYDEAGWATYLEESKRAMAERNRTMRQARFAEQATYWSARRAAAEAWLRDTPTVEVPRLPPGYPAFNAIDHFLGEKIQAAAASFAPRPDRTVPFHREILPIFETHCFSCHQGHKVKGGLSLDNLSAALRGGDGDGPAIVPGRPDLSPLLKRVLSEDDEERMPAKGDPLSQREIDRLRQWITEGAEWPEQAPGRTTFAALADDATFLRRLSLDTVGVIPTEAEVAAFGADLSPERRERVIDRFLADPRWADHQMGYWLDVLAENPNLLVPTLNNTGPFRDWLYEGFQDNKPFDVLVTELIRLEGSERFGGPAGFAIASQNDAPLAAKAIILGSAFLGVEMKCARCHDAPTHQAKQRDVFSLAAMLSGQPQEVPATSSVPLEHLSAGGRKPLIEVTLKPGEQVLPAWPFPQHVDASVGEESAQRPGDSRDRLAALMTSPRNARFAQVIANRVWQRLTGRGLVAELGDWERAPATHPELLRWLGREFVRSGYDLKALTRLILSSHAYQRASDPELMPTDTFYAARTVRRMTAEQVVDSFFHATGLPFDVEPINMDVDSVRTLDNALDLGIADRAWAVASTSNERDRPSLVLPRLQAVTEVMEVFGWRASRPDGSTGVREAPASPLQPALLANGTMMTWLTRFSDDHGLAKLALEPQPLDRFIERLYVRLLSRPPSGREIATVTQRLAPGYSTRLQLDAPQAPPPPRRRYVAWSNHMTEEANLLRLEEVEIAQAGKQPMARLTADWRERCEEVVWAILNTPAAVHIP
jgi:mono/diheme cytochrome c family protein